ncbi:hypothetical protein POM88_037381 [Heracleum sosnowskyi]|uniref:Uncharacterized protein n=1 Tax=Heracleum sosnowskyi TaxID=360622 RepID=A0AAD8HQ24_9APIA|nr:hypothetical protein POM88_037381 [Heracleum sosnowskyi]
MSTPVQRGEMASLSITGIFGGCSRYITTISDGTCRMSQHPMPHKGMVQLDIQSVSTSVATQRQGSRQARAVTCKRILLKSYPAVHRNCSLECKVKDFLKKGKATDPPFLELGAAAAATNRDAAEANFVETTATDVRKKKRKGVPHRAI